MARMKLKAGVTATWGTSEVAHTAFGIVTKASKKHSAEREKIADIDGDTVGVIYFDDNDAMSLDIICKTGVVEPAAGDTIVLMGLSAIVDDHELVWEQKATKKMTVSCSKWKYALV